MVIIKALIYIDFVDINIYEFYNDFELQ